mgnify:CR=1 FL=1
MDIYFDAQCYYEHGHWYGSLLRFSNLDEGSAIAIPSLTRTWSSVRDAERTGQRHFFIDGVPEMRATRSQLVQSRNVLLAATGKPPMGAMFSRFWSLCAWVKSFQTNPPRIWRGLENSNIRNLGIEKFVIPTADNFSRNVLACAWALLRTKATVHVRFVNSEPVGTRTWSIVLRYVPQRYLRRVKIAVEHDGLKNLFRSAGFEITSVPYPAAKCFTRDSKANFKVIDSGFTVGLLGAPRDSKGYANYKMIIESIVEAESTVKILAQVRDRDREIFSLISSSVEPVDELGSSSDFENNLRRTHILVLPYEVNSYKQTSSAMVMEAAERGIPVIAPSETGLGREVSRHGLGLTYLNIKEIPALVVNLSDPGSYKKAQESIERYNIWRNKQTSYWLKIVP